MKTDNRVNITPDSFWSSDLELIESTFLNKNKKITDLPTKLSQLVPVQGSVLLGRSVNIDERVKTPGILSKLKLYFSI